VIDILQVEKPFPKTSVHPSQELRTLEAAEVDAITRIDGEYGRHCQESDRDAGATLTFSVSGGADGAKF
jgi:hypothetical protein